MRIPLPLFLFSAILLTAGCGSGEDALDGARSNPNDFASSNNPIQDFSSSRTGDSSNASGLEANEIRLTMEVPGNFAPDAELTRRNLRIVQPDRIDVYTTNTDLQNLGSVPVSIQTDGSGTSIITFENGQPLAPNVVIDASYGNLRMRALAADADRDIKVNPFSEYLVRNSLAVYTDDQLQTILDCVNGSGDQLCLNKYVWSTIADQVHDFEIDIPSAASLEAALALLANRGDFKRYVDAMADYALLDQASSGKISASSADYNSVFLGIELGQTFLEGSLAGSGQWGTRTAEELELQDGNGTGYLYPALTLTSFDVFNIQITSLATDIPYQRDALIHQRGNDFFARGAEQWGENSQASAPGAATLLTNAGLPNTRLLAGRALYQSVTGQGSAQTLGWTRNPYYLDAFVYNATPDESGPDRVIGGYFSAGKAIRLQAEGDELKRQETVENHYLSVLEIDLLRKEGFNLETLDGRRYNILYLATRFNESSDPVTFEAGLGDWQIDGDTISQSQSYTSVTRDNTGTVSVNPAGVRATPWTISNRSSRLSSGDKNIGRLNLDIGDASGSFEEPDLGVGASNPAGTLMAFNLADNALGNGLLIAAEQTAAAAPDSGQYRLQGIALGMTADTNHLQHYDNALLTLDSVNLATLSPRTLDVRHDVDAETVSTPELEEDPDITLTYSQSGDGAAVFTSGSLRLDGFYTTTQDQFYLRLRDTRSGEELVGLVIATLVP